MRQIDGRRDGGSPLDIFIDIAGIAIFSSIRGIWNPSREGMLSSCTDAFYGIFLRYDKERSQGMSVLCERTLLYIVLKQVI